LVNILVQRALAVLMSSGALVAQGEEHDARPGGDAPDAARGPGAPTVSVPVVPVVREELARFLAPTVAFRPARVAPGASGQCHIVLVLQHSAVVEIERRFELSYARQQGSVTLGECQRRPAGPGRHSTKFVGLPVYDDTINVVVPLSVADDAPHGMHLLEFELLAVVTDGVSGITHDAMKMAFGGRLEVGAPLPMPKVRGPGAPSKEAEAEGTAVANAHPDGVRGVAVDAESPPPDPAPPDAVAARPGALPEPAGQSLVLIAAAVGACFVLLVAAHLWRRRAG
jgi:hypothetical protein